VWFEKLTGFPIEILSILKMGKKKILYWMGGINHLTSLE
jgi:hypothetical protein